MSTNIGYNQDAQKPESPFWQEYQGIPTKSKGGDNLELEIEFTSQLLASQDDPQMKFLSFLDK